MGIRSLFRDTIVRMGIRTLFRDTIVRMGIRSLCGPYDICDIRKSENNLMSI
jgi:hypothetical protein